jgi:hypothetical protein
MKFLRQCIRELTPLSGLSLEELGMRALERLPRDRAIDGIHAFNGMRCGASNSSGSSLPYSNSLQGRLD